ncbi:hypothetical protein MAR_002017 [Mya arenaria]|uniref:Uncharacterized protein n=1 Tax=Mya arenaria TaxID=6604 RepID=A0ABY7FH33_MYAAR|nr:hypothetical protein MAR_002017 [Mya arenaria]
MDTGRMAFICTFLIGIIAKKRYHVTSTVDNSLLVNVVETGLYIAADFWLVDASYFLTVLWDSDRKHVTHTFGRCSRIWNYFKQTYLAISTTWESIAVLSAPVMVFERSLAIFMGLLACWAAAQISKCFMLKLQQEQEGNQ